ncbi:hypothetical protein ACFRKE_10140 [Kitasatospora indigofera]|uniref:Uncharacterized protein n=1 Tax=Kitasatospora indigofera TaxID=67307 RepID=A0A919FCY2_9ACTN|nr:hypothetical protein [Kitasatospora indigofera]GHH60766.1 hypothetical protein GCM10018781_06040 [Kitasatospora indigofera]
MRVGITGYQGLSGITEMLVRGDLWKLVTTFGPYELVGVSCAGEGPESWFAQCVLDHGGKLEVIVPGGSSVFATVGDSHRSTRLRLMNEANAVHRLAPVAHGGLGDDTATALVGMVDEVIAVWDGAPGTGPARVAALARRAGLYVHEIWPAGCEPPA